MNILVTGGCGFIGSNFIRYLLNNSNNKIINLDKLTYAGNLENLSDLEKNVNYTFIKGDICDENLVSNLIKKVDYVVHFAAESHVDNSIKDSFVFTRTNVLGTHILLEHAKRNNIKKFVYISTDEVYGSIEKGSFKETSPFKPNSPYSASKAGADLLARSYYITFGLPVIITRSSNNHGPYQHPEKLIPLFITNLIENKKVPVYGSGLNVRDWLYVLDNCEAINFVLENGNIGESYNIGGNNEKTNIEITNLILKELNKDESYIQHVADRLGHDMRYSLDCTKIKKLGWEPKFKFEDALKKTIIWYKENENWWKKLKPK
jgi:dTDP-glucose 4,6-dehydratase